MPSSSQPSILSGGAHRRHFTRYEGLFFDECDPASAWLREIATIRLPKLAGPLGLVIRGEYRPHPEARGREAGSPTLTVSVSGRHIAQWLDRRPGPFALKLNLTAADAAHGARLKLRLGGVAFTNLLAWLGRVTGLGCWQRFRAQNKNRQLRIIAIETADGETIYDFANRQAPYAAGFARHHTRIGLNIVGFLTAELGIGESARCMVRAADAASLPTALVPLKLHCKNPLGDQTYASRLQCTNPHKVNVVHLDPPASPELDHHHGRGFRAGKYNIAYWAWELPEFPDAWVPACNYFDEIWTPSEFSRQAISMKVSLPVLTMPHAIGFDRPAGNLREMLGLPADQFLFLVLYDLNSYTDRKNPAAAIRAFRESGLAGQNAALVIKIHNILGHEDALQQLRDATTGLPGTIIITETLPRAETHALQAACDCYVSLHRAEGFGLSVAECMYLGKPVICTDWSATAEFVTPGNGCPVRHQLVQLERNIGPYGKDQWWAEADTGHAADWMRRLHAESSLVDQLGRAARATIESRFAPAAIGARYRQRLENIALW